MNIAYVNMQFPVPSETFAVLDVKALEEDGHQVSMYCMRTAHPEYERLRRERGVEDIPTEHLTAANALSGLWFGLRHPQMLAALLRWTVACGGSPCHLLKTLLLLPSALFIFARLFRGRPDVVHLFWGHYPSMVGHLVARFMPNTVLSSFLGAHDLVYDYPGSRRLAPRLDAFFTHAASNFPSLRERGFATLPDVVHRGIDTAIDVVPAEQKFACLDAPVFVSAGRLIADKGFEDAIGIFAAIHPERPKARLLIMGDGPLKERLQALAGSFGLGEAVQFLGHVPQRTLIEHLASAHVFLFMSRYASERLPNAVKEAMFQACVCIVAPSTGMDELVTDGHTGYIVDDQAQAINRLRTVLNDQDVCAGIARRARIAIFNDFNVRASMQRYALAWQEALDHKASRVEQE